MAREWKPWTVEEDAYVLENYMSCSYREMGEHLHRDRGGVRRRLYKLLQANGSGCEEARAAALQRQFDPNRKHTSYATGMRRRRCWKLMGGVWHKRCTGCKEWLPESEYHHPPYRPESTTSRCKRCHKAACAETFKKHRSRYNDTKRARAYALSHRWDGVPIDELRADEEIATLNSEIAALFGDTRAREAA